MLCKIVITQCRATGVENALGSLFWSCWQNIRELTIDDASFRNFERITRFSFFCQHIMHPPLFSTPFQILPEPIQCNEWPDIICVAVFPLSTFSPFVAIRGNFRPDSLPNVVQMQYCGCSAVPSWLPSHNPPIYGCLEAAPEWGLENREIYEIGQLLFHRAVPKHQLRPDISHLRFNLLVEREGNYEISATVSPGLPPLWWSLTEIWIFSWLGPTEPTEPALRGQLGNWIGKGAEITATKAKKNHSHKSEKQTKPKTATLLSSSKPLLLRHLSKRLRPNSGLRRQNCKIGKILCFLSWQSDFFDYEVFSPLPMNKLEMKSRNPSKPGLSCVGFYRTQVRS